MKSSCVLKLLLRFFALPHSSLAPPRNPPGELVIAQPVADLFQPRVCALPLQIGERFLQRHNLGCFARVDIRASRLRRAAIPYLCITRLIRFFPVRSSAANLRWSLVSSFSCAASMRTASSLSALGRLHCTVSSPISFLRSSGDSPGSYPSAFLLPCYFIWSLSCLSLCLF
jgi:hypothetical protein